MAKITSSPLTFIDQTDSRKFEIQISSNLPQVQIYDKNNTESPYSPDWSKNDNLRLDAFIYLNSADITENIDNEDVVWYKNTISPATKINSGKTLIINTNVLSTEPIITYICQATYQNLTTGTRIDFTRIDSGINGSAGTSAPAVQAQYSVDGSAWTSTLNASAHKYVRYSYDGGKTWTTAIKMVGEDGTSVKINGSAYTPDDLTEGEVVRLYLDSNHSTAISTTGLSTGDSYLVSGYLCVYNADNNNFICAGTIQGPAGNDGESSYVFIRYATDANGTGMSTSPSGKTYIGVYTSNTNTPPTSASVYTWSKFVGDSAKNIILSGDSQVFKVSKSSAYTPATIKVTAQTINTSVTTWTYNTNNGQGFVSTLPTGVIRSGNTVTITGSTLATNSVVIKASDGTVEDVFTVYKAFDGTDGIQGIAGQSASMAFLTNENMTFGANASGQITATAITTNVVAYTGTTKVTPTIGTITGLPTGMTAQIGTAVNNEIPIVFTIANNSTLGSVSNNNGSITIPVNGPVYTNLILTWSKVNSGIKGDKGDDGVGISSITIDYGVSDSATVKPTTWQQDIPTVAEGKYLWTRTITDYTDTSKADTVAYIYAKQGAKGDTGSSGSSVTVSSIQYQAGASATTAPTGTWSNSVVTVAEGSYLWTKTTFSDGKIAYGVAKQGEKGSAGTSASLVDITPSALYFKSTTGKDGTFTPEFIYLYPRFQSATYSNWQYSTDGGITWVAASGANGVSIGTYSSVASTLRISRASTLYTDTVTSISFRCNSTTSGVYDTVSIAKIYDVVDVEIGGRNLLIDSENYQIAPRTGGIHTKIEEYLGVKNVSKITNPTSSMPFNPIEEISEDLQVGQEYTLSALFTYKGVKGSSNQFYLSPVAGGYTNVQGKIEEDKFNRVYITVTPTSSTSPPRIHFNFLGYEEIYLAKFKLEKGNKATDWTPAPEDVDANISKVDTRLTSSLAEVKTTTDSIASRVSATETSITTTNNNVTSLTNRVSTAEQKITPSAIVSTVRQSTDYTNDLGKKVGTNEIISKINQTAESVTISANKIGLLGATNIPDLTADKIKGGTLTLGGSSAATQNGQILVKNASDTDMIAINQHGMAITNGNLMIVDPADFYNYGGWSSNSHTELMTTGIKSVYSMPNATATYVTELDALNGLTMQSTGGMNANPYYFNIGPTDDMTDTATQITFDNKLTLVDGIIENYTTVGNTVAEISLDEVVLPKANIILKDTAQKNITFQNASKELRTCSLYAGANDSPTVMGVWDATKNKAVLTYSTDNKFYILDSEAVTKAMMQNNVGERGYQKLPSGLIIQWGYQGSALTVSGDYNLTSGNITFPIAFPNSCTGIFCQIVEVDSWSATNIAGYYNINAKANGLTGFTWKAANYWNNWGSSILFSWMAIGY